MKTEKRFKLSDSYKTNIQPKYKNKIPDKYSSKLDYIIWRFKELGITKDALIIIAVEEQMKHYKKRIAQQTNNKFFSEKAVQDIFVYFINNMKILKAKKYVNDNTMYEIYATVEHILDLNKKNIYYRKELRNKELDILKKDAINDKLIENQNILNIEIEKFIHLFSQEIDGQLYNSIRENVIVTMKSELINESANEYDKTLHKREIINAMVSAIEQDVAAENGCHFSPLSRDIMEDRGTYGNDEKGMITFLNGTIALTNALALDINKKGIIKEVDLFGKQSPDFVTTHIDDMLCAIVGAIEGKIAHNNDKGHDNIEIVITSLDNIMTLYGV